MFPTLCARFCDLEPRRNGELRRKLRDECRNEEVFYPLTQAPQIVETWRSEKNENRPHDAPGKNTPNEFAHEIAASRGLIALQSAGKSPGAAAEEPVRLL
jgi:hypothetical protein